MKQRFKRLLAIALSATLCLPAMSVQTADAAERAGVVFTEEEQIFVNDYGEERSTIINDSWKFHLGSVSGAYGNSFNDADWDYVDLPHDFSITQEFTSEGEAESGFLPGGTGWYRKHLMLSEDLSGKRIVLNFDGVYSHATVYINGKKVGEHHYGYTPFAFDITDYVVCDGATENIIAVEAINKVPSSRWYSGSGIYRDVKLIVTNPVHVAHNGTFVTTPEIKNGSGKVKVAVDVQNDGNAPANVTVRNTVYEKGSETAVASESVQAEVPSGDTVTATTEPTVPSPKLWSTDQPNLYIVRTEILNGNTVLDSYDTEFGFKWYEFVDNQGFKLNGEPLKINGVCMHHDQGALGSAAYYDAIYRQMWIMKDMGVNTIRITHNPGAEILVDICNEMGLLVIEEFFDGWAWPKNGNSNDFSTHFGRNLTEDNQVIGGDSSMTWAEFVLKSTVKRGRNDASIILWSLGNEIDEGSGGGPWDVHADNLIRWTKEVDKTHPVTSGSNRRSLSGEGDTGVPIVNQKVYEAGGVPGYNYGDLGSMNSMHTRYPVLLWSETASAINSRGIYSANSMGVGAVGGHLTSYDESCVGWGKTAHASMYPTLSTDWIAGECVWTGFDYIGEPTPWNGTGTGVHDSAPNRDIAAPNSSYFGIVETTGFPKDNYYLYRSQWNQTEGANTLNLVTAWDSDNMKTSSDGKTPVWVYTNAAKVELYRGDTLIGIATRKDVSQTTTEMGHTRYEYTTESKNTGICTTSSGAGDQSLYAVFNVAFEAGTISAKAFDEQGNDITSTCEGKTSVSTPGTPAKLKVSQDKEEILADGSSLVYISVDVTDAEGNLDTRAENDITFTLTGNGEIMGVDNGDQATVDKFQQPSVMTSKTSAHIKAYAGKALAIVRSTTRSGKIKVDVSASGLTGGAAEITSKLPEGQVENRIESYRMKKHCYVPAGTASVALPENVSVSRADGTQQQMKVTWNPLDMSKLKTPGNFTVTGTIGSGADQVIVSITIHVYGNIVAAKNYSTYAPQDGMPSLPGSLMTYDEDGNEFEAFPVAWNMSGISESDFATVGDIVTISGTVTAGYIGKTFDVTASVRVAEAIEASVDNIAPVAAELTENCYPTSDNLDTVKDENRYGDQASDNLRWTNWNDARADKETNPPAITMKWDTVHSVDEVRLFYAIPINGVDKPKHVTIQLSADGINFTDMEYDTPVTIPAEDGKATEGASFKLKESTTPIAVRVILEPNEKSKVGLTEIEVMSKQYTYEVKDSANLESISSGGSVISGFDPNKSDYVLDDLAKITVSAGSENAAVTILPEKDGLIKIISVSEDGNSTKVYTLGRKAKKEEIDEANRLITELKKLNASEYTPESYNKLMDAISRLEANMGSITSKELKDLQKEIETAKNGLVKKDVSSGGGNKPPVTEAPKLVKGKTETVDGMQYTILDPVAKTVQLKTGNKAKKGKLTIDKVVINGETCTVTAIGANAFKKAKATSVVLGSGVTSIGKNAFANSAKLKSVTIGKAVKSIQSGAFSGCKKLSNVIFKGTSVKTIQKKAFKGTSKKITVKVPKKLKKDKKFKKKLTGAGMNKKLKIK